MTIGVEERAAKSTFWSTLESSVTELLSFTVFLVLARLLNPEAYGIVAIATVFVSVITALAGFSLNAAIVQIEKLQPAHLNSAFLLSFGLGVFFYLLVWLLAPWLALAFDEPQLEPVMIWLGLTSLLHGMAEVPTGLLLREFQFKYLALRTITGVALGGVFGVTLAMNGFGVWALVAYQLTAAIAQVALLWLFVRWRPGLQFSWSHLSRLLSISRYVLGSNLAGNVNQQADKLLVGSFLGSTALGIYSIGYKIFQVSTSVTLFSLYKIALPTFSRLQNDLGRLRDTYISSIQYSAAISLPIFIGIIALADRLIPTIFGEQWLGSVAVVKLLMIASCCASLNPFSQPLFIALGHVNLAFRLSVANTLLNLLGFLIAVRWGIVAVAAAFSIRAVIMLPINIHFVQRYTRISFGAILSNIRGVITGLIIMVLVITLIEKQLVDYPTLLVLFIQATCAATSYFLVIFFLDRELCNRLSTLLKIAFSR